MVITNEPGYYEEGAFGIRIENIMLVQKTQYPLVLGMRPLTLVPYCSMLIDKGLLERSHLDTIADYYKKISQGVTFDELP